jgi:cysteine desulfurase/selenocysteine lyase
MLIESGKGLPFIGIENVSKPLDDIYNYTRSNMAAKQLLSGWDELVDYENNLMKNAIVGIQGIAKTKILGPDDAALRYGVLSFSIEGIHPHDIASMLDEHGIAIRAGMHCAHLLHKKYGINASTRISFGIYNNLDDIDYTIERLNKIVDLMI